MEVRLPSALCAEIHRHAETTYPEECCGVMIGHWADSPPEDRTTVVESLVAAENTREDESRHNRFSIDPRAILKADREARQQDRQIVGYYHSHPDHPSAPSEFDREHAWPDTSYLIVSVCKGVAQDERSWRLADDRSRFDQEELVVSGHRGP